MTTAELEHRTTEVPADNDDLCHIYMDATMSHSYCCKRSPIRPDCRTPYYVGQDVCPCGREICKTCKLMADLDP